ncbi:MAG TPA: hypothetical protein VNQ79_27780 [Blastocatellia bacterium]|nr:hypothetical protein [Blastocatellia bacterium]
MSARRSGVIHLELLSRNGLYAGLYRQQMEPAHHEPVAPVMAEVTI